MDDQTKAPGLKWIARRVGRTPYWMADPKAIARGYPVRSVNLSGYADNAAALAARCHRLQAEMHAWGSPITSGEFAFDGTIGSLLRIYETHEESPYRLLKPSSMHSYNQYLPLLSQSVGGRMIATVSGLDIQRWFRVWKRSTREDGREHVAKARMVLAVFRASLKFGVVAGLPGCKGLSDVLGSMVFETVPPRQSAPTLEMVEALIAAAHDRGRASVALATAVQFETTLRQWDVIGRWLPLADATPSAVHWKGQKWAGLTWANIGADMVLRTRPTKTAQTTGVKQEYDLTLAPLVLREIARISADRRSGPMIVNEATGRPYANDKFSEVFRLVRKDAGIPISIWSRDMRAGAVTEGNRAGARLEDVSRVAGHVDQGTTKIYDRDTIEAARRLAEARVAWRGKKMRA